MLWQLQPRCRVLNGVEEEAVKANSATGVLEVRIAEPVVKKPRRTQIGGEDASADHGTIDGNAAPS